MRLRRLALVFMMVFGGGTSARAALSNADAQEVLDLMARAYEPQIRALKIPLRLRFDESRKVPGGLFGFLEGPARVETLVDGKDRAYNAVIMTGRLAALPQMDAEMFAFTACHELGHVIGGAPRFVPRREFPGIEYSTEGQADYFAMSCFARLADKIPPAKSGFVGDMYEICRETHGTPEATEVCRRAIGAGIRVLNLRINRSPVPTVSFGDGLAYRTQGFAGLDLGYPKPGCRVATFIAGALGHPRPACWFRPSTGR